jgi:hypothetical protein
MEELAEYAKSNDVTLGHFGAILVPTKATLALAKKLDFSFASDAAFDALDCNTLASGDVDVMNTTIQLVRPCLDDLKVLASITEERIPLVPDAPTISEIDPELDISLWNGLFVHKDTPVEAREKIAAIASKTIASDKAKKFAEETGAQIYWRMRKLPKSRFHAMRKRFRRSTSSSRNRPLDGHRSTFMASKARRTSEASSFGKTHGRPS